MPTSSKVKLFASDKPWVEVEASSPTGNSTLSTQISGSYAYQKAINSISNEATKKDTIELGGTYGVGAFGLDVSIIKDNTNQLKKIEFSGSAFAVGISSSITFDKDWNVVDYKGFVGVQLILGAKANFIVASLGGEAKAQIGFSFNTNGTKYVKNGLVDVGFIFGEGTVNAETGVDLIKLKQNNWVTQGGKTIPYSEESNGINIYSDKELTTTDKKEIMNKIQADKNTSGSLATDAYPQKYLNHNYIFNEGSENTSYAFNGGKIKELSQTGDYSIAGEIATIGDNVYYFLKDTAEVVIDGVTHTAGAIAEAYDLAYQSVSEFITNNNQQIKMLEGGISYALNQTFVELGTLAANGQAIDTTKILQKFAVNIGIGAVSTGLGQSALAKSVAHQINIKTGANNYQFNQATQKWQVTFKDDNGNIKTTNIDAADSPDASQVGGYGAGIVIGLINLGINASINSSNWNSNDWLKNGSTTVTQAILPTALSNNLGWSETGAGAAAAAAVTIVSGIISNPNMSSGEYLALAGQAGIAAGSYAGGVAAASALGYGSASVSLGSVYGVALAFNPVALVIASVASVILSKVFTKAIGGVHLNPGETQTLNAAEDQLWKFAKLGIKETDSNGVEKTVLKDAIYVTNADGVTLNKQAMLDSKSVFRVFNGTVATDTLKANFKPTYLLGGKAADNIIGNDDSETIYGYDGSDFLDGRGGNNSIFAGAGNDIILAASGRDFIDAGDGDDFVEVEGGNNVIILGKGDDRLYAGGGNDVINAGEGSDVIQAGHGDNIIILGNPTLADDGAIIADTDISRNEVYAGYGRDNITGSAGRDIIVGDYLDNKGVSDLNTLGDAQVRALGYMNDTIRAGDGGDLVMGGLGQDTIYGGKGSDVLIGGSDLADYSILNFTASDVDFIYGEAGDDIILGDIVDDFNTAEYVNYGTAAYNGNLINDNQGQYNSYTQDFLDGGIGNDYIDGGSSDDTIIGGLGNDVLYGGRKVDKITDGEGNDFIIGGIDNDTLISIGDQYHDFFMFGATDGSDIIKGANTKDSIYFNANVRNDALFKREGNNLVITIKGTNGTKVTVENHFNGNTIDAVIFGDNNPYTLSDPTALKTANGGFLNPTAMKAADGKFLNSTYLKNYSTNRFVQLDYRIKEFEADYKDGTSAFAVNDDSTWYEMNYYTATSDSQIEAETFNGIQIGYEKRKRGWFGGHYSVFKQVKNSILNGTSVALTEKESLDGYFHYTVTQNYDEFNDLIVGAWWGETIKGLDGDDIVFAGSGNDSVEGGDGNDFIHGGDNDDVLTGDGGNSGKEEEHYEYDRIFRTSKWYNYEEVLLKEVETAHDLIFGGDGNDEIYGGFGNDTLYGDSGNDLINGDSGDDNIKGGSGNDTITDTNSHAIIDGGRDDDKITSGNFEDLLWGGEGNDTITSGGGDDVIFADEGDDKIYLGAGTDFAHGGAGNDVIWGEADNDVIHGGDGADAILGGTGSNMLIGGYDNDILYSSGKDILIGGAGNDTVSYFYETASVTINLSGDTPIYGGASANDTFDSIAIYHGSNYNDILVSSKTGTDFRGYGGDDAITGSTVGENLQGNDGNDTIKGNSGGDHMYGGNGNDKIYAGTGDSVRLYGEEGNDTLYLGTGINDANGGNGTDSITYIYSKTGVTINLGTQTVSGGEATGDTIASIENAYGSNYNDIIYGTSGVNTLAGYKGNDFLQGYSGNDVLNGGAGADTIDGGNGIDIVSYADSDAAVRVDLDLGTVSGGTAEGDTLLNVENVNVSKFNDTVIGNDLNNIIRGGEGNDILHGHEGNDTIYGDVGDDVIHSGNDADKLYGGVGNDIFQFSKFNSRATGRDIIYDFEKGKDTLSMTFETDISDIVIQSVTGYNIVSVRGIDFSVQVYGAIAMNDILLAA